MSNKKDKHQQQIDRRSFLIVSLAAVCGIGFGEKAFGVIGDAEFDPFAPLAVQPMRAVPDANKVVVAKDDKWYYGFTGVAETNGVLVAAYLRTDQHLRTTTDIMTARSLDGGRTWRDHRSIAHANIYDHEAIWVAPELNRLRDNRLVLICDKGQRKPGQELPVLAVWQSKERGMSNWIFYSSDAGLTWTTPEKTDDVGGEPERVHELSNGTWIYTRTDSRPTTAIKKPRQPWGPIYYRSTAVFSDDKGKSWNRTAVIFDDPLVGDCEVGICEYEPGKIAAFSRIGDAGSAFGQPSRAAYSADYGKTWTKPILMPFYAHRPIPGKLKSGKMLVTFRNAWGTAGSYAFLFDPKERLTYQPNSYIWDESRCRLSGGAMEIRSAEGTRGAVEFGFYPMEDDDSASEITAEFAVKEADRQGCQISAGCWVRFTPSRVELADRPADGFAIDATAFRRYRIVNRDKKLSIYVDGQLKLQTSTEGVDTRHVRFGNRAGVNVGTIAAETKPNQTAPSGVSNAANSGAGKQTTPVTPLRGTQYRGNASHSVWRSFAAKVSNRRDHSIDWSWTAKSGAFPDQFRRDRFVLLDRNGTFAPGDSGYSGWTQMPDGRICIVDYTTGDAGDYPPDVFAYLVTEKDLA